MEVNPVSNIPTSSGNPSQKSGDCVIAANECPGFWNEMYF
jgi:hypothetical protein